MTNSAIIELNEGPNLGAMRTSSLGRNAALGVGCSEPTKPESARLPAHPAGLGICVRTPQLINDDRESCV
jgi:hypothetical protein